MFLVWWILFGVVSVLTGAKLLGIVKFREMALMVAGVCAFALAVIAWPFTLAFYAFDYSLTVLERRAIARMRCR